MGEGLYKKIEYLFSCLLEVFYPEISSCSICRRVLKADNSLYLCSSCLSQLKFIGDMDRDDVFNGAASNPLGIDPAFDGWMSICLYEGIAREMVHRLKYNGNREIALSMAAMMERVLSESVSAYDIIVPVPASDARMKKRGYNQAELIANELSNLVNIPVKKLLSKTRDTPSQVLYDAGSRWYNVKGSFSCNSDLHGKSVLLVDDVITTGATMHYCAEEIKLRGAKYVLALSFAKSV